MRGEAGRIVKVSAGPGLQLVERMLEGDRVALARLMTLVENRGPELPEVMARIHQLSLIHI